jgi:hypothetical protein
MAFTTLPRDVLIDAVAFAGRAPSIHNSQPWRWRIGPELLDLTLVRARVLQATDPQARLAILSCGTALHHARIRLAAQGWGTTVECLPDGADGDRLARISLAGRVEADPVAARLALAVTHRYTDRRSDPGAPLDFDRLRSIVAAVRRYGNDLRLLRPSQVFELAQAVELARRTEAEQPDSRRELAGWVGAGHPAGAGIPEGALPAGESYGVVPKREFRPTGTALITQSQHHASVFAVLFGTGDGPGDWLAAGEALSAGWLTATQLDVSVLPLSIVIEVERSRAMVGRILGSGSPYLALRFAVAHHAADRAVRTPRLPLEAILDG